MECSCQVRSGYFPVPTLVDLMLLGLINSHTHSSMVYLRGYGDDLPLKEWLETKIWPAELANIGEQYILDSTTLAIAEMIKGGTTCFNDMYFFPECLIESVKKARHRAVVGAIVIDFPSAYAKTPSEYFEKGEAMIKSGSAEGGTIHFAVSPHSNYTVSEENLKAAKALAEKYELPYHIHLHETQQEIDDYVEKAKKRPMQQFKDLGLLDRSLIAVHMTQLTDGEVEDLATHQVNVVHCPTSNMKLSSGFCNIPRLLEKGVNVAVGTDGAASNNSLNMFAELKVAAILAKGLSKNAAAVPASLAVRLATMNAAKALKLDHKVGSIEVGKEADLIVLDLNSVNTMPVFDPVSHVVYACDRDNVTDVWVKGHRLLESRQLTTINEAQVLEKCKSHIKQLQEKMRQETSKQ